MTIKNKINIIAGTSIIVSVTSILCLFFLVQKLGVLYERVQFTDKEVDNLQVVGSLYTQQVKEVFNIIQFNEGDEEFRRIREEVYEMLTTRTEQVEEEYETFDPKGEDDEKKILNDLKEKYLTADRKMNEIIRLYRELNPEKEEISALLEEDLENKCSKKFYQAHRVALQWEREEVLTAHKKLSDFFAMVLNTFITLLLINILVLLLGYREARKSIIKPLERFRVVADEIGHQNFDVEIATDTKDELAELGLALKEMIRELQKAHFQLVNANKGLERKVAERTKELEDMKSYLVEKVDQSTQELRDKIKELSKTSQAMVDREVKMVELKKKIKELAARLKVLGG